MFNKFEFGFQCVHSWMQNTRKFVLQGREQAGKLWIIWENKKHTFSLQRYNNPYPLVHFQVLTLFIFAFPHSLVQKQQLIKSNKTFPGQLKIYSLQLQMRKQRWDRYFRFFTLSIGWRQTQEGYIKELSTCFHLDTAVPF